jgi:GNAT superfamily N-acetyltransferase
MNAIQIDRRGDGVVIQEVDRGESARFASDLFVLLGQLRPDLTREQFRELTTDGYDQGLRFLIAHFGEGVPLAAAGYRILSTSRGRLLYVDDLVTAQAERSRGIAGALMAELQRRARVAGCTRLELDSGVTNTIAHRFYLRHRLDIRAFHFSTAMDVWPADL